MTYLENTVLVKELPDGRTIGEVWVDENDEELPIEEWAARGVRGRRHVYNATGLLVEIKTIEGPYRGDDEEPG